MIRVKTHTMVQSIEQKFDRKWVEGRGENAKYMNVSLGWFVNLEGSHESIFIGKEMPDIQKGDVATIIMEFRRP